MDLNNIENDLGELFEGVISSPIKQGKQRRYIVKQHILNPSDYDGEWVSHVQFLQYSSKIRFHITEIEDDKYKLNDDLENNFESIPIGIENEFRTIKEWDQEFKKLSVEDYQGNLTLMTTLYALPIKMEDGDYIWLLKCFI